MINKVHRTFEETLRIRRTYFETNKEELTVLNLDMLSVVSGFSCFVIAFMFIFTFIIFDYWVPTFLHILLLPICLFFYIVVKILRKKDANYIEVQGWCLLFILCFMTDIMAVSIFAFPEDVEALVTITMLGLAGIFVMPYYFIGGALALEYIFFIVLMFLFKSKEVWHHDLFTSTSALIVSLFLGWVISTLRIKESSSKQKFLKISTIDYLTGLGNKYSFEREAIRIIDELKCNNYCIIVLDVDNFKAVNDVFGHDTGDLALKIVGSAISEIFRKEDLCARIGGDEFVVLMKDIPNKRLVEKRLHGLLREVKETAFKELSIELTCSAGAMIVSEEKNSYDNVFSIADSILYESKDAGRDKALVYTYNEYIESKNRKPKMLIADDEEINRKLLERIFRDDFEIIMAVDGNEAVEKISEHMTDIDVILLDIVMPKFNGYGVLEWRKTQPFAKKIPVVVISMLEDSERKSLELGVDDVVAKPFDVRILKLRVNNVLKNKR